MSERYDIKPIHTYDDDTPDAGIRFTEWIVVDTGNRYCPTGFVFATREEALAQAKAMG